MSKSRREFLTHTSLGLLGMATAGRGMAQTAPDLPPGAPPAFGTSPAVGPEVSLQTFAEAEKLVQIELTQSERKAAADSWRTTMARLYERRTRPHKPRVSSHSCENRARALRVLRSYVLP
jgi:hypothetical protein